MSFKTSLVLILFSLLLLTGCTQNISEKDVAMLNGYWEIEKVIMPNGDKKEYTVNETIDLFHIEKNTGWRKKVKPQFDGKYIDAGDPQDVIVSIKDDKAFIICKTPFTQWNDEILEISKDKLVLKNEQEMEYHYKKAVPFSIK